MNATAAISFSGTFTPSDFDGAVLPTLRGEGQARQAFKPEKVIATAVALATFAGPDLDDKIVACLLEDGSALDDIMLVGAQFDEISAWPGATRNPEGGDCCAECRASQDAAAVPFSVFARDSLGCGISWPPVQKTVTAEIAIGGGILDAIASSGSRELPYGYDPIPKHVALSVRLMLLGQELR